MNKVMVSLCVPSIDSKYEVLAPAFLTVQNLVPLFIEALLELTGQQFAEPKDILLCWPEQEIVFNKDSTLSDYGIQNGDCLYLY